MAIVSNGIKVKTAWDTTSIFPTTWKNILHFLRSYKKALSTMYPIDYIKVRLNRKETRLTNTLVLDITVIPVRSSITIDMTWTASHVEAEYNIT